MAPGWVCEQEILIAKKELDKKVCKINMPLILGFKWLSRGVFFLGTIGNLVLIIIAAAKNTINID